VLRITVCPPGQRGNWRDFGVLGRTGWRDGLHAILWLFMSVSSLDARLLRYGFLLWAIHVIVECEVESCYVMMNVYIIKRMQKRKVDLKFKISLKNRSHDVLLKKGPPICMLFEYINADFYCSPNFSFACFIYFMVLKREKINRYK